MQDNPRFPKSHPQQSTQPSQNLLTKYLSHPTLTGNQNISRKKRTKSNVAFWDKAMNPVNTIVPTPTAKAIQPFEVPKGPFLAPHQVNDTIDLTDDTAPAMGIGSWQPAATPGTTGPGPNVNIVLTPESYEPKRKRGKRKKNANQTNKPTATVTTSEPDDGGIKWELNKLDDDEKQCEDFTADLVAESKQIKLTMQPKPKAAPLKTQPAPAFTESRWEPVTDKNKQQIAPTFVETGNTEKNNSKMAPKMAATFIEKVENISKAPNLKQPTQQATQNQPKNVPVKVGIVNTVPIEPMRDTAGNKNYPNTAPKTNSSSNKKTKDTKPQGPKAIKITSIGGDVPKIDIPAPYVPRGPAGVPKSFLENSWKKDQIMPQEQVIHSEPIFELQPNTLRSIPTVHPAQSSQQLSQQQQMLYNQQQIQQNHQKMLFHQYPNQQQQMINQHQTQQQQMSDQQQQLLYNQQANQQQLFVDTSTVPIPTQRQQYSPSDVYDDAMVHVEHETGDNRESPDNQTGQKRLSAFQRLGPVSHSQAKKTKLTINLTCDKEQSVREVRELEDVVPVHLRQDIIESKDEIVASFRRMWPWKNALKINRTVTARNSKSVMLLEQEQMEEVYERDSLFIQLTVQCYPPSWTKEDVLDVILEAVKEKSFIPCFIEFNKQECKFLVIRCKPALIALHKLGFSIRKDEDVILKVSISKVDFTLHCADFLPRLVLRKILAKRYDSERSLDLRAFTLLSDISHFIYFPLNRLFNQMELVRLQSAVVWDYLTDLNLAHNRITSLEGFELQKMTPRLKNLDLSHNYMERVTCLLRCTGVPLKTLKLEGNPLCHDHTDPEQYVRVVKMMFPALVEIDGTPIKLKGDMPSFQRHYCPTEAKPLVDRFLGIYFPLLEITDPSDRTDMEDLFDKDATLTVTYEYRMRFNPSCQYYRNLLLKASVFQEGEINPIEGATAITKHLCRWPAIVHDAHTFTVDVMHHSENSTILRISGIMKLTVDTLAEDEHMLAFTRTVVLNSTDGIEYKILNEMVYWETPTEESVDAAFKFKVNAMRLKRPSLKLDSAPNDDFKNELTRIFMKLTKLGRKPSHKCLETKEWNLKYALEYFTKLLKLDGLSCLLDDVQEELTAPRVQRV